MKKALHMAVALFIALLMLTTTACSNGGSPTAGTSEPDSKEKKIKIGLTVGTLSNPFFVSMAKGAEAAAKELGGEVIVVSADYDLAKQMAQVEDFITKKVDMILLNAVDSKGIAAAVAQAKAAGIPVIAVDVGAEGGVDATVSSDNYLAGKLAGEYLLERLQNKGNIVIIDGPPVTAVTDRIKGFEDAIKGSEVKVVAKQNGEGNREKALTVMENILQANPSGKIDAVFAINDPEALGVQIAAEQANRDKEFFILGVDGAPEAIEELKKNKSFVATSAQHPDMIVKQAVDIGLKIINGEKVDPENKVPVELVTQDSVDSYKGW
ncbi:substrate-binding domain-containing protein [Ammoniphilus sp. YIM 78166]|uniref:substrate-binding domain-containing protein n=1 Tax=Ammoniphilus sp. YIM 78166 TaxID=1644106 RepID=UPI00106F0F7C|nr:substrate-binding domain-containing protein [Ammoniphilus sp. YIM 78166]